MALALSLVAVTAQRASIDTRHGCKNKFFPLLKFVYENAPVENGHAGAAKYVDSGKMLRA
jgi:hypothetical protein